MTSVVALFQSDRGPTQVLANSIFEGVNSIDGVDRSIPEIHGLDVLQGRIREQGMGGTLIGGDGAFASKMVCRLRQNGLTSAGSAKIVCSERRRWTVAQNDAQVLADSEVLKER
jgi:hypothetical protein